MGKLPRFRPVSPVGQTVRAPIDIFHGIRHLYITVHQDTSASPTAISLLTGNFAHVLFLPSSYPFCDVGDHQPSSTISIHVTNSRTSLSPPNLAIHPITHPTSPHLAAAVATLYDCPRKQISLSDRLGHLTAQLVKSERALKPAPSLHPPHQFTSAHVSQMDPHQVW